jgi:aspartate/methionine/tyrosine aminotransferase
MGRRGELFEWVAPSAGPTAFPRVRAELDVERWCETIAEQAGVLLLPGSVYGHPRHVRIGFGRTNLPQAIARFEEHLDGATRAGGQRTARVPGGAGR